MASWMIHLRVADRLLDIFPELSQREFVMGNIAPDSGVPNEDGNGFTPDKMLSHFKSKDETGHYSTDAKLFADTYLTPERVAGYDDGSLSFYLGYFSHLLTDMLWVRDIFAPRRDKYIDEYKKAPSAFIRKIKPDWYDLDLLYLKENPEFRAFDIYRKTDNFDNTYLDIFERNAFALRREGIVGFYMQEKEGLDREYTYLSKAEAERFVLDTANAVSEGIAVYIS